MSLPPRDALEFGAALLLGTALGAGLTRIALRQENEARSGGRDSDLLGTFLAGARDEARTILDESLAGSGGSSRGRAR